MPVQQIGDLRQPTLVLCLLQDILRTEEFLLVAFGGSQNFQLPPGAQVPNVCPADPQKRGGLSHAHSRGDRAHLGEPVF